MPSVVVNYTGQCADHTRQQALCAALEPLADLSNRLYLEFFSQSPLPIRFDGAEVYPQALLDHLIFFNQSAPPAGLPRVDLPPGMFGKYSAVQDVRLYGLTFPIFDPRRLNSNLMKAHAYNLPFVFLRSADPALDGCLIEPRTLPSASSLPLILAGPELDLRYYLENWLFDFLGWVEHFYLPGLWFWIYHDGPRPSDYQDYDPQDTRARDELFLSLRDLYEQEARAWMPRGQQR